MLRFFKKQTPRFDHLEWATRVATLLEMHMFGPAKANFETQEGVNRKAIGYVYGVVDATLQMIQEDIRDPAVGPPMLLAVFELLFPERSSYYTTFLLDNIASDERMIAGALTGGKEYYDFIKRKMPLVGLTSTLLDQRVAASPQTKPALVEIEPKPETIRVLWEDKETGVRAEWHAVAPHWRLIDPDGSVFSDNYSGEQQVKDAAHGRSLYIKWDRAGAVGLPPIGSVLKMRTVRVLWENKTTGVRAEWHAATPHWRVIDSDGSLFQQCNSEGEAKWQAYGRDLVLSNGLLLWHDVETGACARYQQATPHWWAGIGNNWTSCDDAENAIAAAQRMAQERRDEKGSASQSR